MNEQQVCDIIESGFVENEILFLNNLEQLVEFLVSLFQIIMFLDSSLERLFCSFRSPPF